MRSPLALVLPLALAVWLSLPVPAAAHDGLSQWRAMRAEYWPEFQRARMIYRLDCAELTAYVAEQNWLTNQRIYAEYHRLPDAAAGRAGATLSPGDRAAACDKVTR
jgi:hypothetical protein